MMFYSLRGFSVDEIVKSARTLLECEFIVIPASSFVSNSDGSLTLSLTKVYHTEHGSLYLSCHRSGARAWVLVGVRLNWLLA